MSTIELTKENFDQTMKDSNILFIDFWAEWCGPCKQFGPVFEAAAAANTEISFGKVDTEAQRELAGSFGIRSIPTLAIVRENILVFMQPGALPANALDDLIKQVQTLDMDDVRTKIAEAEANPQAQA